MTRTRGRDADHLPGASQVKRKDYLDRFDRYLEDSDLVEQYQLQANIDSTMGALAKYGLCHLVTLGRNLDACERVLDRSNLARYFVQRASLNPDPRPRPGELASLANGDPRTLVICSTDSIVRAAGLAELFVVGVSTGVCSAKRLHQAGADVVYAGMSELCESLAAGAQDLIRMGLLPPSLD